VSVTNGTANRTLVSPAISWTANTLLVALVSADAGSTRGNNSVQSVINSGGLALTWTRAVSSAGQPGTAEVWWAFAPTPRAGVTVTARLARSSTGSMTVMALTNAASSLVGAATAATNAATGAPSATITTTRDMSMVLGVGILQGLTHVLTPSAGQVIVSRTGAANGRDTFWTQRAVPNVPSAGTGVTISDTYGPTMPDTWNLAVVEIRQP
jgi:hypothetical protein